MRDEEASYGTCGVMLGVLRQGKLRAVAIVDMNQKPSEICIQGHIIMLVVCVCLHALMPRTESSPDTATARPAYRTF